MASRIFPTRQPPANHQPTTSQPPANHQPTTSQPTLSLFKLLLAEATLVGTPPPATIPTTLPHISTPSSVGVSSLNSCGPLSSYDTRLLNSWGVSSENRSFSSIKEYFSPGQTILPTLSLFKLLLAKATLVGTSTPSSVGVSDTRLLNLWGVSSENRSFSSIKEYFSPGQTILDVGCGDGYVTNKMFDAMDPEELTAIEPTPPPQLQLNPDIIFKQISIEDYAAKNPTATFDVITMFKYCPRYDQQDAIFKAANHLLKTGGTFIITSVEKCRLFSERDNERLCLPPIARKYFDSVEIREITHSDPLYKNSLYTEGLVICRQPKREL